jgi:hypothetical protein
MLSTFRTTRSARTVATLRRLSNPMPGFLAKDSRVPR